MPWIRIWMLSYRFNSGENIKGIIKKRTGTFEVAPREQLAKNNTESTGWWEKHN